MGNTYIGIDMGTSSIKLLLIDEEKQVLRQVVREYALSHPREGWSEIEPEVWESRMLDGLTELMEGQDASLVARIGVTGQMHTLVLLDEEGKSVRPAIMWNDKRTKDSIPKLKEYLKTCKDGSYLSEIVSTGSPAANLYWVSREEPASFRRCRYFLVGPDYLVYALTGVVGTNYCEASTSCLYSISERAWSAKVRELIGLNKEAYPPVRGSTEMIGTVRPLLRERFGFSEEIQVIAGTGDNPATAVSTGCLGEGYPVLSLGTSGVLMFPVPETGTVPKGKRILCDKGDGTLCCLVQGVVQSTGESVSWWTRKVLGRQTFGDLEQLVDQRTAGRSPVLFYPHINGDKTIYADPELRGAFLGLSADTGAEELYYAVLEGLCFAVKQLANCMQLPLQTYGALKVVGGGAKSDLWMQTLANVLEIPIERLEGRIGPAYGIALLALATGHGQTSHDGLTKGTLRVDRTFLPDCSRFAFFREKYGKYLRLHDVIKQVLA